MGKFAATLGIGTYGSATILLHKGEFVAGDVLSGRVRLSVTTRIDRAEAIRMDFVGRETLAYDEEETHRVVVEPRHADEEPREHQIKKVNHEKFVYTMLSDAIVLDVPARSYDPGEYEFPFEYQLPTRGLVPSFEFKTSSIGRHLNVRAHATYELAVRVPIPGMFKADLCGKCHPIIREDPSLQVPCSITESKTLPVYFLIFCLRGTCDLTATLEADVVPLGGVARVHVLVNNDSTQPVASVTTTLHQIVTLNERNSSRDGSRAPTAKRQIASKTNTGVDIGDKLNANLTQPIEYDRKGSLPLMPTMRSHFLSFDYELRVKCRQAWCWEDPSVTFPIVLTTKTV